MNIKDFAFSSTFGSAKKIVGNAPAARKPAADTVQEKTGRGAPAVRRERIDIHPQNVVKTAKGQSFDLSAPKGTYVDLVV